MGSDSQGPAPPDAPRALSANTQRAYAADWKAFCAWCATQAADPLPAAPPLVAAHLAALAGGQGRSALRRRLFAIIHAHRRAGHPWDRTPHGAFRDILDRPPPPRPAAALTPAALRRLVEACGPDRAGLRDRALLLLGFAAALRRTEIVAIDREHLRLTGAGLALTLPQGAGIDIPRGPDPLTCPVRAMEAWLARSRIEWGAVFPGINRGGRPGGRLTPQGIRVILRKRAGLAGLAVAAAERLAPHGLRAGGIAEACRRGLPDRQVMRHARQKSIATARAHRRRAGIAGPARQGAG